MNKQLNDIQKNFLRDILNVMGKDDALNEGFANALGMDLDNFNELAEEVFIALGNGRLTVEEKKYLPDNFF
jgi:hypothetical protein